MAVDVQQPVGERIQRYRRVFEGLLGIPATEGNRIDVLRNGDQIFPAMLDAIRGATRTVDLLSYIYWTGDVADAFATACGERARAGVRVRILLDSIGARPMNRQVIWELEAAGCQIEWFRPPATWKLWEINHRTHRKVLICDEEVAFTGGVGIAEPWEGDARSPEEWRDTHVRVRGPAVDGLRAGFASNWAETGRPLYDERDRFPDQPQAGGSVVQMIRGEGETGWTDLWTVFRILLQVAERRLRLTTAYFVPDPMLQRLLCDAARRGVEVDVLVPGRHRDKRLVQIAGENSYADLMSAGVRIWRYEQTMLHAKTLTVDGVVACVGSANFDKRSACLNEEANLVVFDPEVVETLDRHFAEDLRVSWRVDPRRWARRGRKQRALEQVVRLVEPSL